MIIKTSSGFEIDFDKNKFDDMEVLDELTEMDAGNPLSISRLCKLVFTPEEKRKLYDHVRTEDNRVPLEKIGAEITEILILSGNEGKN